MTGKKNLPQAAISEDTIKGFLATESDLGFEMKVLELFSQPSFSEFQTSHGGLYYDPMSGKTREFDIRTTVTWINSGAIWPRVRAALAVECKALSADAPLLVTRIPRREEESHHEFLVIEENQGAADFSHSVEAEKCKVQYKKGSPVGKRMQQLAVREGRITSKDDLYDKWTQCLSSAAGLFEEMAGSDPETLACIIPCLVVPDGALWVADFDESGAQTRIAKNSHCSYFVNKSVAETGGFRRAGITFTHMEIFTLSGFESFLNGFLNYGQIYSNWCFTPNFGQPRPKVSHLHNLPFPGLASGL